MGVLSGKRVLFFSARFFGYETAIKNKLEEMGAIVDYYDDRPSNNFYSKVLLRIKKSLIKEQIKRYYEDILKETSKINYDFVLFVAPETITKEIFFLLREQQKNGKFILYMWDSIKNRKNVVNIFDGFDTIYTFDKEDIKAYPQMNFRPLFYIDDYKVISEEKKGKFDILFIGTAHSDRYKFIKKLERNIANLRMDSFFYLQGRLIFIFRKIFDKNFRNVKYRDISFRPLTLSEVIEKFKETLAVMDIQHPKQTGLTMRTFEVLGSKRKLITTNQNIREYDFYNEKNILIVDRENPKIDLNFFETDYQEIDKKIYDKYSIEGWIKEIFNLNQG